MPYGLMKPMRKPRTFILGGLHAEDFQSIKDEYEAEGWVLTAFDLEDDLYHWRAKFVQSETLIDE